MNGTRLTAAIYSLANITVKFYNGPSTPVAESGDFVARIGATKLPVSGGKVARLRRFWQQVWTGLKAIIS